MAEKQFTTYQADIVSFELREAMLGILNPGRYCGYDTYSSGGTPAGGIIPVHIDHTGTGIQKGTHATPALLSDKTGVVLTPQGTVIHNTDLNIDVNIDDGSGNGGSERYDLVYLEHLYEDIIGDNPSSIGVKKGTPGAGLPTLTSPAIQVAIASVKIPNASTLFSQLTITLINPDTIGDFDIYDAIYSVIGTRLYTENNYIIDGETITQSLDDLDIALQDEEDARIILSERAIDSILWGTLTDNTYQNVSTTRHGLMPKLPGLSTTRSANVMTGNGTFLSLLENASKVSPVLAPASVDWDMADLGLAAGTASGFIDLTSLLPTGFIGGLAILHVSITTEYNASGMINISFWGSAAKAGSGARISAASQSTTSGVLAMGDGQIIIPIDAAKKIYWSAYAPLNFGNCNIRYLGFIETRIE